MSRTKSQEVALRNEAIVDMAGSRSRREVAEKFGISEARVSQIILKSREETSAEESRAMQDVRIEYLLEKQFEILRAPLQVKASAGGKLIYLPDTNDPSGRTPDYSKPVYDYAPVNEASKVIISALDRQAKSGALDLPKGKMKDESDQVTEWTSYVKLLQGRVKALQDKVLEISPGNYDIYEAEVIPDSPAP